MLLGHPFLMEEFLTKLYYLFLYLLLKYSPSWLQNQQKIKK